VIAETRDACDRLRRRFLRPHQ